MKEEKILWPFYIQLIPICIIPLVLVWSVIPTNVLHSSFFGVSLEYYGISGLGVLYIGALPASILGVKNVKKMLRFKKLTILLAIINLLIGLSLIGLLILVFLSGFYGYV